MRTTLDFTLGVILSLLAYLSSIFYFLSSPFTYTLSIASLILFVIGYSFYITRTQHTHLGCLLIIPFMVWSILLKDAFMVSLSQSFKLLACLGTLSTGICLIITLYKYIKLSDFYNLKA